MILSARATANSNIALIKYWGKRDAKLNLPCNSSISMTLDDNASTTTEVIFSNKFKQDEFILNGKKEIGKKLDKVSEHLDRIRALYKVNKNSPSKKLYAKVISANSFPAGTGIASSASGFCALTAAVCKALGLNLDNEQQSAIARIGSGT